MMIKVLSRDRQRYGIIVPRTESQGCGITVPNTACLIVTAKIPRLFSQVLPQYVDWGRDYDSIVKNYSQWRFFRGTCGIKKNGIFWEKCNNFTVPVYRPSLKSVPLPLPFTASSKICTVIPYRKNFQYRNRYRYRKSGIPRSGIRNYRAFVEPCFWLQGVSIM